jgi:hypothetical protein
MHKSVTIIACILLFGSNFTTCTYSVPASIDINTPPRMPAITQSASSSTNSMNKKIYRFDLIQNALMVAPWLLYLT